MAKCIANTKTTRTVVLKEKVYNLELTEEEAHFIRGMVGVCAGSLPHPEAIFNALHAAGVKDTKVLVRDPVEHTWSGPIKDGALYYLYVTGIHTVESEEE